VARRSWAGYRLLIFPEIPDMDIEPIDRPTAKPWGAGEAAAVVPSAIANALFDAVGVRLRSVSVTPAKA
jgi:nicotinate dehydrogenase subunit B